MNVLQEKRRWFRVAPSTWRCIVYCATVAAPTGPLSADDRVQIAGGADAAGRAYRWTVTNHHTSPVVYIEFPHYHASLFHAPAGWTTESTFLVNVGVKDQPGVCRARTTSASNGIPRGRTAAFEMTVSPKGTRRGNRDVLVRFADGTDFTVPDVELPMAETTQNKFLPLIGLSVIALVALGVRTLRGRAARKASRGSPPGAG